MVTGRLAVLILILMAVLMMPMIQARADKIKVLPEARAIMEKWEGRPCVGRVTVDIADIPGVGDGKPDFLIYFLDDPATEDPIDAMALVTLDGRSAPHPKRRGGTIPPARAPLLEAPAGRLWGFVESRGEDLVIVWMDPAAPELWRKWLQESIKERPEDLTI